MSNMFYLTPFHQNGFDTIILTGGFLKEQCHNDVFVLLSESNLLHQYDMQDLHELLHAKTDTNSPTPLYLNNRSWCLF